MQTLPKRSRISGPVGTLSPPLKRKRGGEVDLSAAAPMAPASEAEELAALDEALTALGFTDDAKLERVLHVLTPRVVEQMGSQFASSQKKTMQILAHVNKRLTAQPSMKLPLTALVTLYCDDTKPQIVKNFALLYVERAFQRADAREKAREILRALNGVAARSPAHAEIILRAAITGLAVPEKDLGMAGSSDDEFDVNTFSFLKQPPDRALFLKHALEYLLYQPNSFGHAPVAAPAPSPAVVAMRAVANVAGVVTPPDGGAEASAGAAAPPQVTASPPGLSQTSVARLLGPTGTAPATRDLAEKKLNLLHLFRRASDTTVPPPELLMLYLVASTDADHEVQKLGEDLLRRRCAWDTNRPLVNLEDEKIARSLYRAFLGGDQTVPEIARATPASPAMKIKLVNLLCRSVTAANLFPYTVQAIFTCLYGEGTTTRLKAAGMELAVWVLRHATDAQLKQASPLLLSGMLKLLDNGGAGGGSGAAGGGAPATVGGEGTAPDGGTEASTTAAASTGASNVTAGVASLRGFCYQALGQLSVRTPELVTGTADIASRVFGALASEPEAVRVSVQGAARSLARAYKGCGGAVAMAIEGLLLSSIDTQGSALSTVSAGAENGRRLIAAQWARELFPFDHVPARYLCIVAAGDAKADVREEGRLGLKQPGGEDDKEFSFGKRAGNFAGADKPTEEGVDTEMATANGLGEATEKSPFPFATAVLAYMRGRHPELANSVPLNARTPLPPLAMRAALEFTKRCVEEETNDSVAVDAPEGYRVFLEHCLVKAASPELTGSAVVATLQLAERFPSTFADPTRARDATTRVRHFASHVDAPTRRIASKLCGVLARSLTPAPGAAVTLLDELLALAGEGGVSAGGAKDDRGGVFDSVHGRFEHQDGALRAAGFVAASGVGSFPDDAIVKAINAFVAVAGCKNLTLAGTAAEAIGHVGLAGLPALPRAPAVSETTGAETDAKKTVPPPPEGTVDLVIERLLAVMKSTDEGATQRAARAAGYVIAGGCEWVDADALLKGLFALSKRKNEETQLAIGEALCFAFGGVTPSVDNVLFGSFVSLEGANKTRLDVVRGDGLGGEGKPAGATDALDANAAAPIPAAAAIDPMAVPTTNDNVIDSIIGAIFDSYLYSSRPEERCASCTWLLALITHTKRHPKLVSMLPEIQEAFGSLLGDANELTQEMASRGVSVVYELGTEAQRKKLLSSLMGTLSGEKPKRRRVKLVDDTAVFAEGTLKVDDKALKSNKEDETSGASAGGGGSLNTYKELCSIVTDIGQPDLIYKFMDLANYQAMLNSSKGAAFGFASIAKRAGDALAPHLKKLLPKLFRMQHDPNPKMREAVAGIWQAVVDDPKVALDLHFRDVMDDLLTECGSRTWRNRQSAASALAELLSGRRFTEVEPYLEKLWTAALRSVDDIKETVREAGRTLCRAVRSMTIRLCDAHHSSPHDVKSTIAVVAPLLLRHGLLSPVKEIQALAMDVLMKITKQAGSEEIRPFVPEMVKSLLEALSQMEDSRLNYIEQHTAAIGMSAEKLEHARLQSSKQSPMGETLDVLMGHVDETTMTDLVPALASVLRSGVGLNTRAGTCRFISRLCLRKGSLVRPHAGKLFKSLLAAASGDKSASVTSAAIAAVAAVARHATEARTHQLIEDLVLMYDKTGDDADHAAEKERGLAAHLALELSRNASDALSRHATKIIPLAFVGRFDETKSCAARWEEVWEENAAGASSTLRLYLDEILSACAQRLGSAQYRIKRQGAAATAAAAKAAPDVCRLRSPEMLNGLLAELLGRVWEGKEALPGAVADVIEACPESCVEAGKTQVIALLVQEASRKKATYRKAALAALVRALAALAPRVSKKNTETENVPENAEDFFPAVMPLLRELLGGNAPESANDTTLCAGGTGNTVAEMESAAAVRQAEAKTNDAVADQCLSCLAALCAGARRDAARTNTPECASLALAALSPEHGWSRRAAALAVVTACATRSAADTTSQSTEHETWLAPLHQSVVACAEDVRVSQLRVAAVDALAAAAEALRGSPKSETRMACVKQLQAMRDGDRAPDVRGAAGKALADLGA